MMMSKYNGWTNYETWLVNVWMTNEEGSSRYWDEIARRCYDEDDVEESTRKLAKRLKYELAQIPDTWSGFHKDMIGSALCEVDWDEIAGHMLEDCKV
jgi:hypothetical protein